MSKLKDQKHAAADAKYHSKSNPAVASFSNPGEEQMAAAQIAADVVDAHVKIGGAGGEILTDTIIRQAVPTAIAILKEKIHAGLASVKIDAETPGGERYQVTLKDLLASLLEE